MTTALKYEKSKKKQTNYLTSGLIIISGFGVFATRSFSLEPASGVYNFYFSQGGSYYYESGGAGSNKLENSFPWELSFYIETGLSRRPFGFSYRFFNERSVFGRGDAPNGVQHHYFRGSYVFDSSRKAVFAVTGGVVVNRLFSYIFQFPLERDVNLYFEPILGSKVILLPSALYTVSTEIGTLRRVKPQPDWLPEGSYFFRSYSAYIRVKNSAVIAPFFTFDVTPAFIYDGPADPLSRTPRRDKYPTCIYYGVDAGFSLYPLAIRRN